MNSGLDTGRSLNVRAVDLTVGHLTRGSETTIATSTHIFDWTTSFLSDISILQLTPEVVKKSLQPIDGCGKRESPTQKTRRATKTPRGS